MKTTRRLFSILIILVIVCGLFIIKPAPTKAVNNFWVEVANPRPGANSEYKFHFTIERKLEVHEFITLVFPPGSKYTKTLTDKTGPEITDFGLPIINYETDKSLTFKFNTHIMLDPSIEDYRDIVVTIPKMGIISDIKQENWYEYRFFNPPEPGLVTFQVYTQAELDPVTSKAVLIRDYPMSSPIVEIEPNLINEPAGYSLDFDLNTFSDMKAEVDTIQIQFPPECTTNKDSSLIQTTWILINDSFLGQKVTFKDNLLTLPLPEDLKSGQHVSIKIDSRVGIINPIKPGLYELTVMTSAEDRWFRSFPYFVSQEPVPALLKIDPAFPNEIAEFDLLLTTERVELNPLDTIYVRFPETIKLPATIPLETILINNKPIFQVMVDAQVVTIKLRSHAKGWMPLEIKFTKGAGIKTPPSKEPFCLELKVQKDAEYTPTNLVELEHYTLAVVECFTAIWSLGSIYHAYAMDMINQELGPNRVTMINYYVDSTDDHPFPRLSCQESEDRMKWYMSDHGIPNIFFNGTNSIRGVPNLEDDSIASKRKAVKEMIEKNITRVNQIIPPIKITADCIKLENNTYQVSVEVQRIGDINFNNYQLVTTLTESNIPYAAINSNKIHYFVFREFLKPKEVVDTIGIPMNLVVAGGNFKTQFTFDLNTDLYKNDLNIVFFVQDMTQKNILQGISLPVISK